MQLGRRVGRYELEGQIGEGASAVVFAARHSRLMRREALKIVKPEFRVSSGHLSRFLEDAQAAAILDHPNIVRVHDVEEEPIPFIAMEFVEGTTLEALI